MSFSQFFTSVEFYVIATVLAAAIIALCIRPAAKGPAKQHLLGGHLLNGPEKEPGIELECRDDGSVVLTRTGLENMTDAGAVSIAVNIAGGNMVINERLTYEDCGEPRNEAEFVLDFLAPDYYHVRYESESVNLFAAFTLHVRPGIKMRRELSR